MADRQRPRAPAESAVALLLALAGTPACSGEVVEAETRGPVVGLAAPEPVPAPAPPPAVRRSVDPRRAAALEAGVRALIGHWTSEARKLSQGKAHTRNVRVAVSAREVGGGELVALRADEAQAPASNLKLVTTAAALVLLGREAAWVTPFEASAPLRGGVLAGDLVVRAAGDPLADPSGQGRVEERLREVARELRARGLERVEGDLVLDEGTFAAPAPGPSWPDPSQHWAEYCALSGGFSVNGGVLHARVKAGAVGGVAHVELHPRPHGLKESISVRTIAGTKVDVRVGATLAAATVRGELGQGLGEYEAEFAHPDPVALFGALVRDALGASGIELRGTVRRARGAPRGVRLAELRSPLAGCLAAINAESRNGVADQVFLSLGEAVCGEGTRAGGARAVELALARLDVDAGDLVQVDGSGLSRENRVTARAVTALLERVLGADPETARLYRDSLAVMGRKGTLEERLRGTAAEGRVFAKTGWIAGVSALSGLVLPPQGEPLVFSILVEYPSELGGLNTGCFKKLQDELVLLLLGEGA